MWPPPMPGDTSGGRGCLHDRPAHDRTPGLGLWSQCIFQGYTSSLPTSLSCIASVDKRCLAEETGCGDSVRGPGTRGTIGPAGRSLEPVTYRVGRGEPTSLPSLSLSRCVVWGQGCLVGALRPASSRDHQCGDCTALLGGGPTPPPVVPIHSPHEPASGGNENSSGGALPLRPACTHSEMLPSRSAPIPAQQKVALACLFAIPAGGPPTEPGRRRGVCHTQPSLPCGSPTQHTQGRSRAGSGGGNVPVLPAGACAGRRSGGEDGTPDAALVAWCLYHLAHGRLTRIQRLFGAETCSTPVLNRTQRGLFQLFTRWSTRYCNQDLRQGPLRWGATPTGAAGPCVHLHCQRSAKQDLATAGAVDCGTNSASLTWAPSVFGAARFGR
jgi:hypothetical protein